MKRLILLVMIFTLLISSACTANEPAKTTGHAIETKAIEAPVVNETQVKLWKEDIDYLKKELPAKHYNLFFKLSKVKYDSMLDELKQELPTLTENQIRIRIAEVIAAIGDTHTSFGGLSEINTTEFLPIFTYWFRDGLYVTGADEEYAGYLGSKLVKINDIPIEKVMEKVNTLISHENQVQLKQSNPNLIINPTILKYFHIIENDTTAVFTFQKPNKEMEDVKIKAKHHRSIHYVSAIKNMVEKPLYMKSNKWFWHEYRFEDKLLYVQYNNCWDKNMEKQYRRYPNLKIDEIPDFEVFTDELISMIDKVEVEKLVIDLRNNGGGSSPMGTRLVKKLAAIKEINQKGKLFVIVGRETFSSAILNTVDFANETEAIFLGEPTKGKPNHYGEVQGLTLPNSKIIIGYSTKYFKYYEKDIESFVPDFIIEPTYEEWSTGKDPVLDAIVVFRGK